MYFKQYIFRFKKTTRIILCLGLITVFSCEPNKDKSKYDQNTLDAAYAAAGNVDGLKSLLVNYKGDLIGEEYFGVDIQNTQYMVRSITKSIVSILIGIAIDRGYINDIDMTLEESLTIPYNYTGGKGQITLEDLLTMSSGLEWNEMGGNEYGLWMSSQDKIRYVLDKNLIHTPGTVFNYNSGTSHLLSVILTDAVGESAFDFAETNLFSPLEIDLVDWRDIGNGYHNGGSDITLTARGLMKIGELYLNMGEYDGNQIVPASWVVNSIYPKIDTGRSYYGSEYGYLWWIENIRGADCFYAMGYGGQFLFIFPDMELIIVATSNSSTLSNAADQQWVRVYDFIAEEVLSAFL